MMAALDVYRTTFRPSAALERPNVMVCLNVFAADTEAEARRLMTRMPEILAAYLRAAEALLTRGVYPGIATHDERIVAPVCRLAREREIAPERFEFQLLYGVKPALQQRLVRGDGYRVRVYVPTGRTGPATSRAASRSARRMRSSPCARSWAAEAPRRASRSRVLVELARHWHNVFNAARAFGSSG
jgi:hypothetical protein